MMHRVLNTRQMLPIQRLMLGICLLCLSSCNESFSPKGPYEQRLVVYSVLTTQSDTQYVRVYSNYNPPSDNPLDVTAEHPDTGAIVTISDGTRTVTLHDTLLFRPDTSRYRTPLHTFVTALFRPQPGTGYTLTVATPSQGTVSSQTIVPAAGALSVPERFKLYEPALFMDETIDLVEFFAPQAKGYLCRFLIEYSLKSDSTFRGIVEVPLSFTTVASGSVLPQVQSLQRITFRSGGAAYPVTLYVNALNQILGVHGTDTVFKLAKFYCIQVDPGLYDYYNIANGFQDTFSTRTDQPDYTNIQNGLGVFGSFNVDSIYFNLNQPITLPTRAR